MVPPGEWVEGLVSVGMVTTTSNGHHDIKCHQQAQTEWIHMERAKGTEFLAPKAKTWL